MTDWITVKDLAQIQGITPRAVRKSIAKEKYITREVEAQNGIKYEIFVPSLNSGLQNLIDFEKYRKQNDKNAEPKMIKTELYPPHAKKIALARYDLVRLWVDCKNENKRKTEAGKDFIFLYNKGEMYPELFKILKSVSIGTIYRWAKSVKVNDDYTSLIPDYEYSNGEYNVNLTKEEELVFRSLLLSPNKTSIGKATKLTKFILKKRGFESPSSERTFRRFAENYQRKHYDIWVFAREGQKALRDKVEPYIIRDASKLEVGDVFVADGHRLYSYLNQVYVTTENLNSEISAKIHTKKEIAQIKMINCLLRRRFENSCNLHYVEHRSAEYIWRKDKKYTDLINKLSILIKNTAEERTGEICF